MKPTHRLAVTYAGTLNSFGYEGRKHSCTPEARIAYFAKGKLRKPPRGTMALN